VPGVWVRMEPPSCIVAAGGCAECASADLPRDPPMLQDLRRPVEHQLFIRAEPTWRWVSSVGLAIAAGITYYWAARLSLVLLTKPDGVAVFWPAAGLAAGVLIVLGPSARLPVAAGAIGATIVARLLAGDPFIWTAVGFGLCNATEAVLVAWLIERRFGSAFSLGRLSCVLGLVAAAIVGSAISGIGAAAFGGSTVRRHRS